MLDPDPRAATRGPSPDARGVLDGEALVALATEPLHLLGPVDRNPPAPAVQEPGLAFLLVTARPAPERPLAHPQWLRCFFLVQLRRFPAAQNVQKHRHAHPLKGLRPAHPTLPKRARPTGQITRYLNRTYRLPATPGTTIACENQ